MLVYLTDSTAIQKRLLWQPKTFQSKVNETHTHTYTHMHNWTIQATRADSDH